MSKPIVCKNCDFEYEGKFCPQCGQKAKTKRITTKQVFSELRQRILHYEQGFWYTTRELLLRPGYSVREYLEGKRVRHVKPLKFLFWAIAISFLVFHLVGLDQIMMEKISNQQGNSPIGQRLSEKVFQLFTDHPAIMMFLMVPMIAMCSRMFFRRQGYNFAEHIVLNAYLMGELSLASVITSPVSRLLSGYSDSTWPTTLFSFCLWVLYFMWAYGQFFQNGKKSVIWIKGALTIAIGYFVMILSIGVLVAFSIIFFRSQMEHWLMAS